MNQLSKHSNPQKRIGLLGGSFNPPHIGHMQISLQALEDFQFDEVWWLITLKNPFKSADIYSSYKVRKSLCEKITKQHKIFVSDYEKENDLTYTVDTITKLQEDFDYHFTLLMGSDCFVDFHEWKDWQTIIQKVPLVIFPRPDFVTKGNICRTATEFVENKIAYSDRMKIFTKTPPVWTICNTMELIRMSSREIRAKTLKKKKERLKKVQKTKIM